MRSLRKKLTASALMALAVAAPHASPAPTACQCPRVTVQCPEQANTGAAITYTVQIEGFAGKDDPTYNWMTSAGVITAGQGTSSIAVGTGGLLDVSVEATVEVGGLPAGCPKTASCATSVPRGCGLRQKYDEYGDVSFADEKARLDNFAVQLLNEPGAQGYVMAYGGRVGRAGEAERRAARARDYLAGKMRGSDALPVVAVDGGYREELTVQLWSVPPGVAPPVAEPSVDSSEVKFMKEAGAQGRRRRRP